MSPETGVGLSRGGCRGLESWGETTTVGISNSEMGDATTALDSLADFGRIGFSAIWTPFSAAVGVDSSFFAAVPRLGAGLGGTSSAAFKPIGGNLLNPSP